MITKSIYATGSKGHHRFTLNVQEDSVSVSDNSSLLSFNFIITATNSSWQWRSYNNITYSITIGDNTYTGTIPNFNGSTTTLKTGSNIEIPHDSDGTKTIAISFSVIDPNSVNYTCGNASESSTMQLTDLHTPPNITDWTTTEQNNLIGQTFAADKIVRYLSIKNYHISATTFDDATLSKFRVYNGTQLLQEITSSTSPTDITIDYSNVELQTFIDDNDYLRTTVSIEVEDSMGGISRTSLHYLVYDYQKPNVITTSSNIKRNGQSTGKVVLNLSATFKAGTIGATTNNINTISLQFAYWQKGQSESTTYYTIPITTMSSSVISIDGDNLNISNWNMAKNGVEITDVGSQAYYFKIKFTDAFGNIGVGQLLCNSSEYLMCKFTDRVDFKKITQKNREVLTKGIVAYSNASGTNTDITLDYNSSDYSHCRIFYKSNEDAVGSVDVDDPNGKTVMLIGIQPYASNGNAFLKSKKVLISGTSITNVNYSEVTLRNNASPSISNSNNLYITKVEFY